MPDLYFNNRGMSLMEVLIALILLLLLSTTIGTVFTPATMWVEQARSETTACNYARAVLENMRDDRTLISEANNGKYADEIGIHNIGQPVGMRAEIGIKSRADLANLYNITVKVRWNEGSGELKMVTVLRGF